VAYYTHEPWPFRTQDLLKEVSSYYLIDPDKGEEGIVNVAAHTVLAASPNQKHFAEWSKRSTTLTWCMPVWRYDELKVLQKYIPVGKHVQDANDMYLDDLEFERRWSIFGGRIRFVYDSLQHCKDDSDSLKSCIATLGFEKIIKVVGNGTLAINQEGKTESTGSSMIFIYDVFGIADSDPPYYKWRMIKGNYQTAVASPYVEQAIRIRYWHDLMNTFNPESVRYSNNALQNGRVFEFLASFLLGLEGKFHAFKQENLKQRGMDHTLDLTRGERHKSTGAKWNDFLVESSKLTSQNKMTGKRQILIPNLSNKPVVDLMDAKDRRFQFCAGKSHGVNVTQLEKLVKTLKCSRKEPLLLYFVILESHADEFRWNWTGSKELLDQVKDLVQIFVIFPLKKEDPQLIELLEEFKKIW
jgi:hypothetical protein